MTRLAPLLLLGGCITKLPSVADPCAAWPEPGLYRFEVETVERDRKPYVYVPASAGPRDLVVMLHGGAQNSRDAIDATGLVAAADQEGFVAVFPDGLGWPLRSWNAGDCCGTTEEARRDIDDVAFLDRLVAALAPEVCGDRVLATGFSNGGMMVHRWACEGDAVDGAVPVAGPLVVDPDRCSTEPLPIRHYHGTADPVVPAAGGDGTGPEETRFPSVEETMATWRARNRCTDAAPEITTTGDTTCQRWDCAAPTELCLVEGWGHLWPGGIHGPATDADVTGEAWRWFQALDTPTR